MKLDEMLETLNSLVPEPEELAFNRFGVLNEPRRDIRKIGICVDLTTHVLKKAQSLGIDFLVVHQVVDPCEPWYNSMFGERLSTLRARLYDADIGGYGLSLALATADGGLIDSLADIFSSEYKRLAPRIDALNQRQSDRTAVQEGEHKPVNVTYKGVLVRKAAVRAQNQFCLRTYGYGIPGLIGRTLDQTAQVFIHKYHNQLPRVTVETLYHNDSGKEYPTALVSTGPLRKSFLEKLETPERLIIAGSIANNARDYLRSRGISVVAVGDFESVLPGMVRFTHRLDGKIRQGYGKSIETVFIPNYPLKK